MKNSIKTLLFLVLVVIVLSKLSKELKKEQAIKKFQKEFVVSEVFKKKETTKKHSNVEHKNESNPSITYTIKGLGNVSDEDLQYASQIVEDFFGYNTKISGNMDIPDYFYYDGTTTLNADKCIENLNTNRRTVFITYDNLYDDNLRLRGYTRIKGNAVIVRGDRSFMKETIIHEIGHTFGLHHCDDLSCIMAINNDEYDSGDFCDKCKRILNR